MGVINVTPDSFSDGGRFLRSDHATQEARRQLRDGADLIDLGAQSTRPGAEEVGAEEECRRLLPALKEIRSLAPEALISVWIRFWPPLQPPHLRLVPAGSTMSVGGGGIQTCCGLWRTLAARWC